VYRPAKIEHLDHDFLLHWGNHSEHFYNDFLLHWGNHPEHFYNDFLLLWGNLPVSGWNTVGEQVAIAGMTEKQVENMTKKWHIYMTKDGRISLAGLSSGKAKYLAQAIDDSIRNV
jgi:hypothetical protein